MDNLHKIFKKYHKKLFQPRQKETIYSFYLIKIITKKNTLNNITNGSIFAILSNQVVKL